ncbi:mRNA interferase RelE/StbE, partial [Halanaerobium congolense]
LKSTLNKIKKSPELGKPLGNKSGIDLSGCLKIYFYRKKYRVVYQNIELGRSHGLVCR